MGEQVVEQREAFSQRDVVLERTDDGFAESALAAELLSFGEKLIPDRDGRAHMQNLPKADALVNKKYISSTWCEAADAQICPLADG